MRIKLFKDYREEIKEGIKDLKVIYTDLDGTMFNDMGCVIMDSDNNYYFEALKILSQIKKKKWDLVLVSGRNKVQLRYNAQMMGLKDYIAELGAEVVYDLGREVHVSFDHGKNEFDLTYEGKDLKKITELLMNAFPGKIEGRMEWSRDRSFNALFFGEINLKQANELLKNKGYKGLTLVDNGISSLVKLDLDVKRLHIYNLMPDDVNKARGVKLDKKLRNLSKDNCIALGDSLEDIKMASEVKYFFLMRNALEHREEIEKEMEKYDNIFVTEAAMNRGWAEVIGYISDEGNQ